MIIEAEGTKDGAVGTVEISAEMSGSFFAVCEAGDNSWCKWTLINHDLFTILIIKIQFSLQYQIRRYCECMLEE